MKTVAPTGITAHIKALLVPEIAIGKDEKVIDAKIRKSTNPEFEPALAIIGGVARLPALVEQMGAELKTSS